MLDQLLERWKGQPAHAVRDVVMFLCAFAVLFSVAWSFLNFHQRRRVARGRRSVVDTSTMLLFFAGFSWLLGRQVGALARPPATLDLAGILIGIPVVLTGAVVNVLGRHQLGPTWANQIAIYEGHEIQIHGLFALVRHPLYASIIWMFLGAALASLNWAALLATTLVFVPAMRLRARQEERLLLETFPEYAAYRRRTGEFFPRLFTAKHQPL